MAEFVNAAPKIVLRGAEDNSTRVIAPEKDPLPQHLPLFYLWAEKGTTKRVVVSNPKLVALYGAKTFDPDDKYWGHTTRFLNLVSGNGNTCMVQRLVPDDAKKANAVVYLDILEDDRIPNYKRLSDGSLVANDTNTAYLVDEKNPYLRGYRIKWIKETIDGSTGHLGELTPKVGTMYKSGVPGESDTRSTMYPIFEIRAAEVGEAYNNLGFSINTVSKEQQDTTLVNKLGAMVYSLSLYERPSPKDSPIIKKTLFGESEVNFSFKDKAKNPATEQVIEFEYVYNNNWFNETDPLKQLVYNDFDGLYFYRNNYNNVLKMLMQNEAQYISTNPQIWADREEASTIAWFDYTTDDTDTLVEKEYGLINPFVLKSVRGTKYFSIIVDTEMPILQANQTEISMTSSTPIFLGGGTDGTLTNEEFEKQVVKKMDEYLDENSEVHDTAVNVESIFYDSGFTLDTKKELTSFIALRKDTFLVLSSHDATLGDKYRPLSEERAIAVALKTRLNLVPESEYYGTHVCRAVVVPGTGKLTNGTTNIRIPQTYELADKASKMMGAGNGKWKPSELFDTAPKNILNHLTDIQPHFIPEGVKPTLWNEGLVWSQPYDRHSYHFPGLQTVYDNDTSVLNSFFTAIALCTLNKIGADAWREFTGSTKLTDAQFIDKVTAYLNKRTDGIFAGMFVIIHDVIITDHDEQLGYVWHATSKIYANNMKTVCVFNPAAYRMSDLGKNNN